MSFLEPHDSDSPATSELRSLVAHVAEMVAKDLRDEYDKCVTANEDHRWWQGWRGPHPMKQCEKAHKALVDHLDQFGLTGSEYDPREPERDPGGTENR